ncbi:MAG: hypothetical protein RIR11_2657 [Bacteroidota bacterium]|jgi:hypothetical protein
MKKIIIVLIVHFFTTFTTSAQDTIVDSEEVLRLVEKTAITLEARLNDAVSLPEVSNLLIKLMESYEDFNTIALMGIYCHGARVSAELGRNQCNWVNFVKEKDMTSLMLRAQEARLYAFKMRDAAANCLLNAPKRYTEKALSISDILRNNAEHIEHALSDGLASKDIHILAQKIEHAESVFHHSEMLGLKLNNCTVIVVASREGLQACTDALSAEEWSEVDKFVKKALSFSTAIKTKAAICR